MNRKSFLQKLGLGTLPVVLGASAHAEVPPAGNGRPDQPVTTASQVPPGAWTLAVLPDTQSATINFPDVLYRQFEWLVQNQGRINLRFVAHVGDIVNNNSHPEWLRARQAFDKLFAAKIPYSLLPGNHDLGPWGMAGTRETLLNDYFTFWDCRNNEATGYFEPQRLENTWHRLTSPTGNYLILALEFGPRDAVLEWANGIVAAHPEHKVIVTTHAYLFADSTRYDFAAKQKTQHANPKAYAIAKDPLGMNDGEDMWRKFVSRHANIQFVLSGHVLLNGTGYLLSRGEHGNAVHQILANYQSGVVPDRGFGGAGFTRFMHFAADGKSCRIRTYSPWLNHWLTDQANDFEVTL